MVPAIAIALLVVGSAMALVFDRLWQDAAFLELHSTGEAAALAAANRLADDDSLKKDADGAAIGQSARTAAADIALKNSVGGLPVKLWDSEDGDIEIGRYVQDSSGTRVFVRTTEQPDCVLVHAEQGRGASNPVGLLVRDLTGAGRLLRTTVQATADHHVIGLRPYDGVNCPMLPIALAATGPTGWDAMITAGTGPDTCGVPRGTRTIQPSPDGIAEMTALSAPPQATTREQTLATVHVFDIGKGLAGNRLAEQCHDGWSIEDLSRHGGEVLFGGAAKPFKSTPKIPAAVADELSSLIGQTRMCLVYDAATPGGSPDEWTIMARRLVAVRILAVQHAGGTVALHVQPAVVATRTAITDDSEDADWNPYVCKVSITN
ncbi:MAG TPA: hypothetical protein VM510_01125 [Caulifigura sp.]|nr:hypothetical protein [Caulifigura sp.]